jgi:predicted lipoprotein with Yx(FWY)xxD motif
MRRPFILAGLGFLLMPGVAFAQPAKAVKTPAGPVLETPAGKSLYVYDGDKAGSGHSNCGESCIKHWPPLLAGANAKPEGNWSIITRADGKKQWAYKGRPLYTWFKDIKPGQINGNGYDGNTWHSAKP